AVREMKADGVLPEDTTLRSSKYLNNLIEQDHRTSIAGIELMHRIRKGQFSLAARFKEATAPAVWKAVLSA
ncbi:MAG: IS6 family transposase, partial [Caldimonas sp.]